ncbi:myosin heavy chain, skeletal muscle-like isoform X8 [Tachysurus ichikawai]
MFDVNGVRDTRTDSTVPEVLTNPPSLYCNLYFYCTPHHSQVDRERSKLEERVRELEELLCEAHREYERKNKDGERAEEAYSILQSQYEETLKQRDELLKVSLPEAERKYKQAMKMNAQLEKEKSKLMSRVDTLQQLGHLLCETRTECIEAKRKYEVEQKICKYMQDKLDEKKANRKEKLMTLRESLTAVKEKYEEAMVYISQVEDENSNLRSDVETLQDSVQELDRELTVSRITCKELTRECDGAKQKLRILQSECSEMKDILLKDCETVPEVHRMLMSQNEVLKKLLKQNEELMQASLDEAESKYEKTVMTNAELENKNSDLMSLVTTLQGTVEVMEKKLAETCRTCDDIRKDCEQEREAHTKEKLRCADFRKALSECSQLLKENEQELRAHNIQISQYDQMTLTHNEKLLKKQMAEAEKRYEQEKETNAHLVNEKLDLMSQVENLKGKVEGLGELLAEKRRQCAEALLECEQEREAYSIMQSQCDQMKETLSDLEKSHTVSLAKAVEKYNQVMESNVQLENEKLDLMYQVHKLEGTMQQLEEKLTDSAMMCDAIKQKYEQERQAYSILKSQYNQMKETLQHNDEPQSASLAEADEKYEPAMESSAQLDDERYELMSQIMNSTMTVFQERDREGEAPNTLEMQSEMNGL